MKKTALIAALAAGLSAPAALAQGPKCMPRESLVEALSQQYGEVQMTTGTTNPSGNADLVLEVWANLETGSFTVMLSRATGISCIVSVGEDFGISTPQAAEPAGEQL